MPSLVGSEMCIRDRYTAVHGMIAVKAPNFSDKACLPEKLHASTKNWKFRKSLRVGLRPNAIVNPIFILHFPPIFPFLPTHNNDVTRGELKIGRSLERNCPCSLRGVSNAPTVPAHCYSLELQELIFTTGQDSPNFSKFPIFAVILPPISRKVRQK